MSLPPNVEISRFVKLCIDEDVGSGDLTADLIPVSARVDAKNNQPGTGHHLWCGLG